MVTDAEWRHALELTINQRDRAVRALAASWPIPGAVPQEVWKLLAEPWAQEILNGD